MPNIHELIDNVALQISEKSNGRVWFSNLDLKNAYSHFKLGDMPNEFQRVMDSLLHRRHSSSLEGNFGRTQSNSVQNFINLR